MKIGKLLESEKSRVYVDNFYKRIAECTDIERCINFIHDAIGNRIQYYNRTLKRAEYETSITIHDSINMCYNPFGEIMLNTPSCICICIQESDDRPENFMIRPYIRIVTDGGFSNYHITGVIVKNQNNEYFMIAENEEGQWIKYENGFSVAEDNEINKYNVDIGYGQIVLCFYKNTPNEDDSEEHHDVKGELQEVKEEFREVKKDAVTKKSIMIKEPPAISFIDELHFQRMFNPHWEFEHNDNKGIRNNGHTCHVNVILQFLYSMDEIVHAVSKAAAENLIPAIYFHEIFQVLSEDNPEISASSLRIQNYFAIDKTTDYDAVETLELFLNGLKENLISVGFDIFDVFAHDYYSKGTKIIAPFRVYARITQIEKAMQNFIIFNSYPAPEIFYVNLPSPRSFSRRTLKVPFNFTANNIEEKPMYRLYSITAYASLHFVQFINKGGQWIVFNDEYCYNVTEDIITDLFKKDEEQGSIYDKTKQHWRAYILFYRKEKSNQN